MNGTGPSGTGYTGIGVTGDVLIHGNLLVTGTIDPVRLVINDAQKFIDLDTTSIKPEIKMNNAGNTGSISLDLLSGNLEINSGNNITINPTSSIDLTSNTGNISIDANNQITIIARSNNLTGAGIIIDNLTPNIEYSTGGVGNFIRIANNGTITTQSVTNSAVTDLSPNSLILQQPSTSSSLDISADTGLIFGTSSIGINSSYSATQIVFNNTPNQSTMNASGFRGPVYHTDQPTTNLVYYLTFVQSGGVSGYYNPCFDSATLTYNPNSNLLLVTGLQLSTTQNNVTFTSNTLTIDCNFATNREFNFPINADMNTLNLTNRRNNSSYRVMITNNSGASRTINSSLGTGTGQPNRTSYSPSAVIVVGETWIMTINVQVFAGTTYNCVSLEKFV
jgi:hypothetical protein